MPGGVVTTARLEWDFVAGTEAVLEDGTFYPESTLDMKKSFPDDIGKRPARRGKPGGRERKHISDFVKQVGNSFPFVLSLPTIQR
eukprot:891968-Rhodomonas_salina.4